MIRPAEPADVDALLELVHELAAYEREPDAVAADRELFAAALFGPSPKVFAHVAAEDGRIAGMAIWYLNFSTWTGHHGIYLEDLFVQPDARGHGIGAALLSELAAIAQREGYTRIDWSVLDWNDLALGFYRAIGALPMVGWTGYRLTGDGLAALADRRHGSA